MPRNPKKLCDGCDDGKTLAVVRVIVTSMAGDVINQETYCKGCATASMPACSDADVYCAEEKNKRAR